MAQYNKSFNFKNGLQVDNDNFIINASGLVGIGSSIPSAHLDVVGSIVNSGEITSQGGIEASRFYSSGVSTFFGNVGVGTDVGITADPLNTTVLNAGIVTAVGYYGDGSFLSNIVGFATTKFILQKAKNAPAGPNYGPSGTWGSVNNTGLATGGMSLAASADKMLAVGIGTNQADWDFDLVIGNNPENTSYVASPMYYGGIGFNGIQGGSLKATGIITAVAGFVGPGTSIIDIDGGNISQGTISNDRLPVLDTSKIPLLTRVGVGATTGISTGTVEAKYLSLDSTVGIATAYAFVGLHTGNVTGNLTGNADTATTLNADSSVNTSGIITAIGGFVGGGVSFTSAGIGNTSAPAGELQVHANGTDNVDVFVTSENKIATVAIGRSSLITDNNAAIRFNNDVAGWWDSSANRPNTLDIVNYSQGNINFVSNPALVSSASSEGVFTWRKGANATPGMVFDPSLGRLSIGSTTPEYPLDVTGIATFRTNAYFDGSLEATSLTLTNALTGDLRGAVYSTDGSKTFINKGIDDAGDGAAININTYVTSGVSTFVDVNVTTGGIGINTDPTDATNNNHLLTINNKDSNFNQFIVNDGGQVGVKTDQFYDNVGLSVPTTFAYTRAIGVGRTPASAADFGVAGNAPTGWKDEDELIKTRFMIPPTVTQTERGQLRNNSNGVVLPNGSLIFNSTHKQLQMYVDGWVGIATVDAAS